MPDAPAHLGTVALRERGWTPALVRDLLGEPDKLARNPHCRSASPMRLWAAPRVEAAEASPAFVDLRAKAERRSRAAKAAAETRRGALLAEVARMTVTVAPMPFDRVMAASLRHWENSVPEWRYEVRDGSDADTATRLRWGTNYARHCRCEYDRALEDVASKVGVAEAVQMIRAKVYGAIAREWPELADECRRQAEARGVEMGASDAG